MKKHYRYRVIEKYYNKDRSLRYKTWTEYGCIKQAFKKYHELKKKWKDDPQNPLFDVQVVEKIERHWAHNKAIHMFAYRLNELFDHTKTFRSFMYTFSYLALHKDEALEIRDLIDKLHKKIVKVLARLNEDQR